MKSLIKRFILWVLKEDIDRIALKIDAIKERCFRVVPIEELLTEPYDKPSLEVRIKKLEAEIKEKW